MNKETVKIQSQEDGATSTPIISKTCQKRIDFLINCKDAQCQTVGKRLAALDRPLSAIEKSNLMIITEILQETGTIKAVASKMLKAGLKFFLTVLPKWK
jgi:hypothetical protein